MEKSWVRETCGPCYEMYVLFPPSPLHTLFSLPVQAKEISAKQNYHPNPLLFFHRRRLPNPSRRPARPPNLRLPIPGSPCLDFSHGK